MATVNEDNLLFKVHLNSSAQPKIQAIEEPIEKKEDVIAEAA